MHNPVVCRVPVKQLLQNPLLFTTEQLEALQYFPVPIVIGDVPVLQVMQFVPELQISQLGGQHLEPFALYPTRHGDPQLAALVQVAHPT